MARGSVAKNSSIEAPYQNRSDAAFWLTLDAAVSIPRSESKSDLLDQTDRCPVCSLKPETYSLHIRVRAFAAFGDEAIYARRDNEEWYGAEFEHSIAASAIRGLNLAS
jgi:hypothetical protein